MVHGLVPTSDFAVSGSSALLEQMFHSYGAPERKRFLESVGTRIPGAGASVSATRGLVRSGGTPNVG